MDFDQNGMDDIDPFTLRLLGPPPQGMDIHESSQPANYTIVCISLAVAIVAILLRWAARKISGAELQADDYVLNFVAFVCPYLCPLQGKAHPETATQD